MAIGVLLLVDLAIRATDLGAMYTDAGMFSRAEICRRATTVWNWSFHFASGSTGYQVFLFALAAVLALGLAAGFMTRMAVIGSWLLLVSLHHRVPPILSGAEVLHRMLLFWAMFLPLGRVWSVDAWLARRREPAAAGPDHAGVLSAASSAILLQMALMYFFSALSKTNETGDWSSGRAIAGSLAHSFYASPFGSVLLQFPWLLKGMTWFTLGMEWIAPFLLFSPKATARLRWAAILALTVMHVGVALCLQVGLFSFVALAGLSLFLPAQFWNSRWFRRVSVAPEDAPKPSAAKRPAAKPRLYYLAQGACLLLFLYVVAVNINAFPNSPLAPLSPERWRPLARGLDLDQAWGMFSAIPSRDGWYVARARLSDGSEVDLLRRGQAVDWARPPYPAQLYPNQFWQKLFREMSYDDEQGFQFMRAPVAEYLCRQWNARHPPEKRVATFEFIFCTAALTEGGAGPAAPAGREQLLYLDLTDR